MNALVFKNWSSIANDALLLIILQVRVSTSLDSLSLLFALGHSSKRSARP
jgi:hypothetical protein